MMRNTKLQRQAGFTLVEIMVVIVILGMLAGVGAVAVMRNKKDADNGVAKTQSSVLKKEIEKFVLMDPARMDIAPDDLWDRMLEDKYIPKRSNIKDPWNEDYVVAQDDDGNFFVFSKGKDKQRDTDDDVYEDGLAKDRGSEGW